MTSRWIFAFALLGFAGPVAAAADPRELREIVGRLSSVHVPDWKPWTDASTAGEDRLRAVLIEIVGRGLASDAPGARVVGQRALVELGRFSTDETGALRGPSRTTFQRVAERSAGSEHSESWRTALFQALGLSGSPEAARLLLNEVSGEDSPIGFFAIATLRKVLSEAPAVPPGPESDVPSTVESNLDRSHGSGPLAARKLGEDWRRLAGDVNERLKPLLERPGLAPHLKKEMELLARAVAPHARRAEAPAASGRESARSEGPPSVDPGLSAAKVQPSREPATPLPQSSLPWLPIVAASMLLAYLGFRSRRP